jgi:hypothetical protein
MKNAKAYASGLAAFFGAVALILASQPIERMGVEYFNQLQWANVILAVLASYGIVWVVPNKKAPLEGTSEAVAASQAVVEESLPETKRGAHRADTTALKLP